MLVFCVMPAWGLTLKVTRPGDSTPLSIELHATKRTELASGVKMADGTTEQVGGRYNGTTGLSDYDQIPYVWKK